MRKILFFSMLIFLFFVSACDLKSSQKETPEKKTENQTDGKSGGGSEVEDSETPEPNAEKPDENSPPPVKPKSGQPKTVTDYFSLLPQQIFALEGCDPTQDKGCKKARKEYLKNFKQVEDTKNGYFKAGCDGGQSCIEMALFKRPDATYVVAVAIEFEMGEEYYFLDYKNGVWSDISKKVIPGFSKENAYKIPRFGTTIEVYSTKLIEKGEDYEMRERGGKIYDLEWKNGKFVKK